MPQQPEVVVLGGAAIDIIYKARGAKAVEMFGQSNPSSLAKHCMGGVGRNIAEVLARLEVSVALLTMVGSDELGKQLREGMRSVGIDTRGVLESRKGLATATYTALLGNDGELAAAAADMEIFGEIDAAALLRNTDIAAMLHHARYLVVDANVSEDCAKAIVEHTKKINPPCKIVFEAISRAKCTRCLPFLHHVDFVKPNLAEAREIASKLLGHDEPDAESACEAILRRGGAKAVLCTMGADGALIGEAHWQGTRFQRLAAVAIEPRLLKKVTGAGDTLIACTIYAMLRGQLRPADAAKVGLHGARLALMSTETINPDITVEIPKRLEAARSHAAAAAVSKL